MWLAGFQWAPQRLAGCEALLPESESMETEVTEGKDRKCQVRCQKKVYVSHTDDVTSSSICAPCM